MPKVKSKLKEIVRAIRAIKKDKDVNSIKVVDVLQENSDLTEWDIRKLGGLQGIKNKYFPTEGKNLGTIHEIKRHNSYVTKLEKQLGEKQAFEKAALKAIVDGIKPLPRIKLDIKKKQKSKTKRELVMVLNDTHYGLIVDGSEIGNINQYGWTEASRRTAMVVSEVLDFKPHTRQEVETVHLILNGDMINGLHHALNYKSMDQYIHQVNGALFILTHVISHLLKTFRVVKITGISGNHDDSVHKREHGNRVITEKYDNYLNAVYYALSTAFRDNNRAIFNFPKTLYADVFLPAGRALITHGDTLFSRALGNPGTSINVKSLSEEVRKFNASEIERGNSPIKLVIFGHTHTFAHFRTTEGVEVYVAPSLSGTDGYAHSLNINTNLVGQVVFESTSKFIMGDTRLIRVTDADKNVEFDKLIPVFSRELKWSK